MSRQTVQPIRHPVNSTVVVPGSKSITNRALLLAALVDGDVELQGVLASDDTQACMTALQALGVRLVHHSRAGGEPVKNNTLVVSGCNGGFPHKTARIDCRDAGTVTRFLIPLCAAQSDGEYHFTASKRMCERPLKVLLQILEQQGAEFQFLAKPYCLPFIMKTHGLKGGEIEVDISESSQFLSGLLLAAPLALAPLTVRSQALENKPYVHMTQQMLQDFASGIRHYTIEPDASTASYFFAVAALTGGTIHVPNLPRHGLQGDTRFLDLLEQMGCRVIEEKGGITVTGCRQLQGLGEVSMSGFSDTFMTVAALAVFADRSTTLTGLAHTRLQESDRVSAMAEELGKLGVKVETTEDSITIHPSKPVGTLLSGHNDHRIAMSLALIGTQVPGVVIDGAECVSKTCPQFFEMLSRL